jgi:hypothetical protein
MEAIMLSPTAIFSSSVYMTHSPVSVHVRYRLRIASCPSSLALIPRA